MSLEIDQLQAGDEVIIESGKYGLELVTVDRTTPCQIIIGNQRFWRPSGSKVGVRWFHMPVRLALATPALKAKIYRSSSLVRLQEKTIWGKLNDDQIARIIAIIDETKGTKI